MDFKVSSGIGIEEDTEQTAEPYLEQQQQRCHFLGTSIHCSIPI